MQSQSRHQCLIYEGSPSLKLRLVATILQRKLREGYRCIYLNSAPMVAGMGSTLSSIDVDVASEVSKTRLILSSDPGSPGEGFDSDLMIDLIEDSLNHALKDGFRGLWISGDMTWEFGPRKDFSKLLEYELKLEELFGRRLELQGICQYHQDTLPKEAMRKSLLVHPNIVINETLAIVNPHYMESTSPGDRHANSKLDEMITELCRR